MQHVGHMHLAKPCSKPFLDRLSFHFASAAATNLLIYITRKRQNVTKETITAFVEKNSCMEVSKRPIK